MAEQASAELTAHTHAWTHDHMYLGSGHARAERRTRLVTALTAVFMVVEIAAGVAFGSMALLADGVHMATHVAALGLAAGAYWLARRHARNPRFSFGSGKFGDLAAFASAIILGLFGLGVAVESGLRLYAPVTIHYGDAIVIAAIGLGLNIVSAFMLHPASAEGHDHDHHHGHDLNLRAAYLHVVADAATSVLAVIALTAGALFGWGFLDPVVGLLGAFVIARWSVQLTRASALVLLDVEGDPKLAEDIRHTLESEIGARVADLHLWRLGPGHLGLIVSLVSADGCSADQVKDALRARYSGLSHVTVEVAVCATCAF